MDASAAFNQATRLREKGDLPRLRALFAAGDTAVKAAVLNGLCGKPGGGPGVGSGILALAVEGVGHPAPEVRRWAGHVIQEQGVYGADVAPAVEALLQLLGDPDAESRRMAAYAIGNVCKQRLDWSRHFTVLRRLLRDENLYVPEAAARALANLSRAKCDIGPAVADLARVLAGGNDDYNESRKEAAKALLHHARKSPVGCEQVRRAIRGTPPDAGRREVRRFLDQLGEV